MPNMTGYESGDVILVPFPFTDQSTSKRRPAVVISSSAYHADRPDVILMAITSQVRPTTAVDEVPVTHVDQSGLLKPSVIKPVIATIARELIIRKLGRLHADDQQALRNGLRVILGE